MSAPVQYSELSSKVTYIDRRSNMSLRGTLELCFKTQGEIRALSNAGTFTYETINKNKKIALQSWGSPIIEKCRLVAYTIRTLMNPETKLWYQFIDVLQSIEHDFSTDPHCIINRVLDPDDAIANTILQSAGHMVRLVFQPIYWSPQQNAY